MNNQLKPQDLRIGNYVKVEQDVYEELSNEPPTLNCYFTVQELTYNSIYIYNGEENVGHFDDGIIGIPLTEEILLMAGFKHYKDDAYELKIDDNRTIQINNLDTNPHLWLKDEFSTSEKEYVFIGHPINLHQLQNLIYSLTGEELEINLK